MIRVLELHDRYRDPANPYVDDPIHYFTEDGNEKRTLRALDRAGHVVTWPDMEHGNRLWAALPVDAKRTDKEA